MSSFFLTCVSTLGIEEAAIVFLLKLCSVIVSEKNSGGEHEILLNTSNRSFLGL